MLWWLRTQTRRSLNALASKTGKQTVDHEERAAGWATRKRRGKVFVD
jgi:hypothetical protein